MAKYRIDSLGLKHDLMVVILQLGCPANFKSPLMMWTLIFKRLQVGFSTASWRVGKISDPLESTKWYEFESSGNFQKTVQSSLVKKFLTHGVKVLFELSVLICRWVPREWCQRGWWLFLGCVSDNFYSVVLLPDAMSKLHKLYIHLFNTYLVNTYISGFVLGA